MVDEDFAEDEEQESDEGKIALLPTLADWMKYYGRSCEGNDQKAVRLFREYESREKFRRLQHELLMIKENKVRENVLDAILHRKRKVKYQGYDAWASLMLMWMVSK